MGFVAVGGWPCVAWGDATPGASVGTIRFRQLVSFPGTRALGLQSGGSFPVARGLLTFVPAAVIVSRSWSFFFMDRKSIFILIACFVLLMLWMPLVNVIYPPVRAPRTTNAVAGATQTPGKPTNPPAAGAGLAETPSISMPSGTPAAVWQKPDAPEQLAVLETAEARYTFTSHGGGLKLVELKEFPETVGLKKGQSASGKLATINHNAPLPLMTLLEAGAINNGPPYTLTKGDGMLRAERVLSNGLAVVKEFRLGTNHSMNVVVRVENRSSEPVRLPAQELVIGTATLLDPRDTGQLVGLQWYNGTKAEYLNESWFANRTLGCLPGTPRSEYLSPGGSNVVWAAVHNRFFAVIAAPRENAPQMLSRRLNLPPPTKEEMAADGKLNKTPYGFQTAFLYPAQALPAGQSVEHVMDLFTGPKEYNTLARLGKNQDLAMNFSAFFGWFAKALLLSMNGLHSYGLSYGLAIITITIIIKLLFWPLTQASTRSMKRMQALQPEMKALQEKYKDDPKKMNVKLMEFMKENKVSPMGGCLPIMLQIPVFIGFYQMLQSSIELRGAPFLWARDLSQSDTVIEIAGFPINPLPLIMGVTQFWQARLTPPSPGVDPMQQKMMQYMPLIFIFILYNFPAGLALYWTVQNLLSILQMKLTKATKGGAVAVVHAPSGRKKS